jgi:cell division septal protein FtsQ
MNAAKKKRQRRSLLSRLLPFFQGGWRRMIMGLILIGLFTGGGVYGWRQWGPQIVQGPEFRVTPDQIEVTAPPEWIRSDVKAEVIRDGSLTELSLLDKQLTVKVAQAFTMHNWVERVTRVSKHHPARVVVDLVYRKPVAMVEVVLNGQPGLLPVDINGVLLPPEDFTATQTRDYLRVAAEHTTPVGQVGTAWGDPRIHGAAHVAAVFQGQWKTLGLYSIVVQSDPSSPSQSLYSLETTQGTRVIWGTALNVNDAAQVAVAKRKLTRLFAHVEQHGPLDANHQSREIDLREKAEIEPRTAVLPVLPYR